MQTKKILWIGVGSIVASILGYAYYTKKQFEKWIETLQFEITGISNIQLSFKALELKVHLQIANPSAKPIKLHTGFIKAEMLRIYDKEKGSLLAFNKLNTNQIQIPSGGVFKLPPTQVQIPLLTGGRLLATQITNSNASVDTLLEALSFELDISAFGYTKTIKI